MIKLVTPSNLTVRIWLQQELDAVFDADAVNEFIVNEVDSWNPSHKSQLGIAKQVLEAMTDINAVEVLDARGNGEVLYKDWP